MRILLIALVFSSFAFAPTATKKATIMTNACCGMSERIIEKALLEVDGVKSADLDLVTSEVTVRYDNKRTEEAVLRQAIAASGFQADDLMPRPKAVEQLPGCCRSGKNCSKPQAGKAAGCGTEG